jgi:hypothetical protein
VTKEDSGGMACKASHSLKAVDEMQVWFLVRNDLRWYLNMYHQHYEMCLARE